MKRKILFLSIILFVGASPLQAQQAARQLAQRILGKQAKQFEFVHRTDTVDFFSLSSHGGKIRIEGNNDNSMAMGLNYYLKEYAHVYVSWYASQPVEGV